MYLLCCEVFRPELEWLAPAFPDAPVIRYHEQGLHDHPDELRRRLCAAIGELEEEGATRIILGYGLCGRGMTGVTARRATLVLPRVHDCIPVLLGCPQSELGHISRDGSTYWMSAGWLRYSQLEFIRTRRERYDDYLQRFGSENAEFLMAQESDVRPLTPETLPAGLSCMELPGHLFSMVGFRTPDDVVYLAVNTHWEEVSITLPKIPRYMRWLLNADTYGDGVKARCCLGEGRPACGENCCLKGRTVAVFTAEKQ